MGWYSKTKAMATQAVLDAVKKEGLNACVVHPSGILGPQDYAVGETTGTIIKIINGEMPIGMGGSFNLCDVRDLAAGCIAAADRGRKGECYILGNEEVTLKKMCELLDKDLHCGTCKFYLPLGLAKLLAKQMEKKAAKVIEGENLDLIIGSIPAEADEKDDVKEKVKANIMKILAKEYDIEEEDFLSAEIEVVPAGEARDYGFDRSMIMGYGHDDRVCAYPSFEAIAAMEKPEITSVCLLVDKEEIGSVGASGMQSRFFENTVAEVMNAAGTYSELALRRALKNSSVLSSDVSAAFDPNFPSVMTKRNAAYFGRGLVFNKYTGARGKSGSNDANAEYVGALRAIMDRNEVSFQTAELGKVDQGGGGTIAYILANYGMRVIDSGVAVLNMHAPWEIISKVDLYEAYRGYIAFLKEQA